jgi:hypothetical protein
MADPDEKLTPADPRDLTIAVALALTSGSRLAKSQSAEALAMVVAERLVAELARSGYVIMRRPATMPGAGQSPGARTPGL